MQVIPAPEQRQSGLAAFLAGFQPQMERGTDMLLNAMMSGQLSRGPVKTGRKVLTDPSGKRYTGTSFAGRVPAGFQLQDEMKNRWQMGPSLQALQRQKLEQEMNPDYWENSMKRQKMAEELKYQQAMTPYYQAMTQQIMGQMGQDGTNPQQSNQGMPQINPMGLATLYRNAQGDPVAEEALSQLMTQQGIY